MTGFLQDLRYAIRSLARTPGFTIAVVLSLGLGVGVNTAIFSLVDVVLLQSLPVPDPDRLVSIYHQLRQDPEQLSATSYPNFEYYREHNDAFSGLMTFARLPTRMRIGERVEKVSAELVSANYFSVLGVDAVLGRTFLPEEGENGSLPA